MHRHFPFWFLLALTWSCHKHVETRGESLRVGSDARIQGLGSGDLIQEGTASWYGHPYHGRKTSSGEVYDMEADTAAHPDLPFGTRVRVVNVENQRSTVVRINDRGPFVKGRIIDLSKKAAREIGILGPGTGRVRLYLEGSIPSDSGGSFLIQVGTFSDFSRARKVVTDLEDAGYSVLIERFEGLYRVRVGPYATKDAASSQSRKLKQKGYEVWIISNNS
ncbi:MAG: septal ring lytic transglycosylase RlpA family protein [Acidobacteria bacterium]|nr:septal ring lytic transglycosylase RlpA family protein [Acidobacteriota bacterium]MCB9397597.1 septal ring lytic transglycosylase RlpA family protein [Acidobacteriota bacterium]